MQFNKDQLRQRLEPYGQEHLLDFWDELTTDQRQHLAEQIAGIDFEQLATLVAQEGGEQDWGELAARAQSPPAIRLDDSQPRFSREQATDAAERLMKTGKVGAILVAGGQGTRLGFPHPKGMFAIGPVTNRTLFQMHFEQLSAVAERYGTRIPLFLMTSPATHAETVDFLDQHDRFGLPAEDLQIFCQGTMPAVDGQGRVLLAAKDQIALSPDGHGGMLSALQRSGGLARCREDGLEQLFYFQIDNPLVSICDRRLLGYHALFESEMSTLVVAKQEPGDKVGNVVAVDGRLMVIEYSDLPAEVAARRGPDGQLVLWAGSIAVHVFRTDFLQRAADSRDSLPFHRASKKVPFVNSTGQPVSPDEPNAIKFEKFIFDLMPLAQNAIVVEGDEAEVFAPLKNASGEPKDTPETTRAALVARSRRWIEAAGGKVQGDAVQVEISPSFALDADDLKTKLDSDLRIAGDTYLR